MGRYNQESIDKTTRDDKIIGIVKGGIMSN